MHAPSASLRPLPLLACLLLAPVATASALPAQEESEAPARTIQVHPRSLELIVGQTVKLDVSVLDPDGTPVEDARLAFFSRSRGALRVDRSGEVHAVKAGSFTITILAPAGEDTRGRVRTEVPVTVQPAKIAEVTITGVPEKLYVGTHAQVGVRVVDEVGYERDDLHPVLVSTTDAVAVVDEFGRVHALEAGEATLQTKVEDFVRSASFEVLPNPVRSIELDVPSTRARTGDVLPFVATARDADGAVVADAPIRYSVLAQPDDSLGEPATGQVGQDGRFVAEQPGHYTVVASCAGVAAERTVRIDQRDVKRRVRLLGHGAVRDVHTSDLWVWEGVDGRDYAVTGTWGANGDTLFWDVTDPSNLEQIAKITVDARTVNDVKVSEDGTLCVISREGASNRKNGIVLIDVTNPREPKVVSTFTDQLTGGVHNLFIYDDHVFALSAGQRYDIIDIQDRKNPRRVGSFEIDSPGTSIHDVWVVDGIAYSSNWKDGVWMVDVGNGVVGGTVEKPVPIGHYTYPSGWNHAAFPYYDEQTGKFYVIAGDEAFPYGLNTEEKPTYPRGWLHFIDFTDPKNPREVARYEVPEAGTHNLWVEGDTLYVAYYNGGLRVVDLSGDLKGDLYRQGREIAWYLPTDHEGKVANAPMVWGPQPHKGKIFFSDWNSGLWAVELDQPRGE